MADFKGILIFGELAKGRIIPTTKELMQTGRSLCDESGPPLSLLLVGQDIQQAAHEAITLGADKVYTTDGASFEKSLPEHYVAIITHVCEQIDPSLILFSQTDMGRETAPRLAARLGTSVCLDCLKLTIDKTTKMLLQTKPVYGGNAVAVWASANHQPHVVTMRPRASEPAKPDPSRKGEVIPLVIDVDEMSMKSKLLETVKEEARGISLEEAKVIVAGGGGIGGREGFQLLEELARVLGGTIGITRVPSDEGWMSSTLEIGQTGHIVSPEVYIAVGISGAPQHLAGCSGSKCIVAINKDPEAHIFKEADFGIVGDYREVLPALIEKLKALLSI